MKSRKLKERRNSYTTSIRNQFGEIQNSKIFGAFCEDMALLSKKIDQSRRGLREETEEVPW
jgi:hypothetical protein